MRQMSCCRSLAAFVAVIVAIILACLAGCAPGPPVALPPVTVEPAPPPPAPPGPAAPEIDARRFARIDAVTKREIAAGHLPGAVVLVGHQGRIVYRKAFGMRAVEPLPQPMTPDTVFDIASMTKVVATTTAIMQLAEHGRLRLVDPVAKYWPEFAPNGKGSITLRQLLTHTSGMRAAGSSRVRWSGYQGALAAIAGDRPVTPPGTKFRYSDVNFIVLGEVVRRASGP